MKTDAVDKELLAQVLTKANEDVPPSAEEVVLVACACDAYRVDVPQKLKQDNTTCVPTLLMCAFNQCLVDG